ncbi:hypothetical protein Cgig2_012601 [Carnegiea gigantea]|uniref:Myb/SANT-like domain-containing protein n=1 Tax=Carnegiea gigantea TaxID=171969 RepID=A0A9Q1Q955_9CARY|nr:hypothetical protein Cgig2_012601 [Carnegiea gigantea]
MMASPKDSGSGKTKRKWKEEEDDALIKVLKDIAKLPESNLKAQPHVYSPLRHLKGIYNVVHDMIVGSCTSGFGWDPETKSMVAEKEVWKAYVKNHPRANDWRGKPCPYYEDLSIIFGKDCASGKDAQGSEEMEDEVNEEGENEASSKGYEPESSYTQEPSGLRRVRASDNLVKGLSEVASILGREIRAASSNISQAIDFDVELSEKHSKLNEELANLGLITMERHRAARKIASELESVDVFFSIPDAERKECMEALLIGDI